MKLVNVPDWHDRDSLDTANFAPGSFFGIAIGPESDVGSVRVEGSRLQAGRWLAFRREDYKVARDNVPTAAAQGPYFASLARLQLLLAEDPCELAVDPVRANGHYTASIPNLSGGLVDVLTVPFEGRRCARFMVTANDLSQLQVIVGGITWSNGQVASAGVVNYAIGDLSGITVAFYIGGTDKAECYQLLDIGVQGGAGQALTVDVETFGELR